MRWLRDTLESARQSSVLVLRSRMFLVLLAAMVVMVVGFTLIAQRASSDIPGDEFCGVITVLVFFQFGLPFAVLYFGVVAVHGEISDRTSTYLFVQPLRRSSLLLGRWLSVVLLGGLVAAAAMTLLHLGLSLPHLAWNRGLAPDPQMLGAFVLAGLLAVAAYGAVGVCFGALFKRPLIAGIAFVVAWEFLVSHSPPQAGVRGMTVADPVRRLLVQWIEPAGGLRDVLVRDLDRMWLEAGRLGNPITCLLGFTGVFLVLAVLIYARREYDSRVNE